MASFYQNLYSKQDMLPPAYLLNHKPDSYHSTELDSNEVYPSVSLPYSNLLSESNHQYHGLSLTLGSHHPQLPQLNSDLSQYSPSLLTSQANDLKNIHFHYPSFDLAQALDHGSNYTPTLCNSRYVKAAQDLLNELVSLHTPRDSISAAEPHESTDDASHDLQNKVTRLLSMLDELDRRYKKYRHQMQAVVSSFDILAGCGAARPYTALALQTISRQFRCLRDAIKKQIRATQKSLGEHDGVGVLSRLRYVDQQLRQQKAHHQFGVMRQPWRPQRGLPETAVSVLRAWLFEHFLHPYPKDSEKLLLARHAGLTRSQVANWFINARVRLWKPMIEEMYKEEFGDTETELKCSSDHAMPARETSVFDDRDEEFQGSMVSAPSSAEFSRGFQGSEVNFGLTMQPSNQVSLALGLQRDKKARLPKPDEAQGNGGSQSSTPLEYYYTEPVNNQHRFGNTHLLSDFVA